MGKGLKKLGVVSAILAFVICLIGGLWILSGTDFETGVGIYFVGKAFFVGPLLLITTFKKTAVQS
ncbi:MAG: hypothetical protein ACYS18_09435 [Planctomycetota bacterium]|jgi:hypothetical protein